MKNMGRMWAMRWLRPGIFVVVWGLFGLGSSGSVYGVSEQAIDPAWSPIIYLIGDGSPYLASQRLVRISQLQNVMVNNTLYDAETERFVDNLWRSLEDFNLAHLYNSLPIKSAEAHALQVQGRWLGDSYAVSVVDDAERQHQYPLGLGDSDLVFKIKKLDASTAFNQYALSGSFAMGVGATNWQAIQSATNEALRLGSLPAKSETASNPHPQVQSIVSDIHKQHPLLSTEDIDFLTPFWRAYPNLVQELEALLVFEDVVQHQGAVAAARHYKFKVRINNEELKRQYPKIHDFMDSLGDILKLNMNVESAQGVLANIQLDTQLQQLEIDMTLANGGVAPMKNGRPLLEHVVYLDNKPTQLTANVTTEWDVFGVKAIVRDLQADLNIEPSNSAAVIKALISKTPRVDVSGAFLSILPTSVIDFFIPSNIQSMMTGFLDVACRNGINASIVFHNTDTSQVTRTTLTGYVVALDNPFVSLGMRIVNNRLAPDQEAAAELQQLFFSVQRAFQNDFKLFMNGLPAEQNLARAD